MNRFTTPLQEADPEVQAIIKKEKNRQNTVLELIPSENVVSHAVLDAVGSVLTNKYSEGYPHKRYYGGNEFIDEMEELAINRAKKLFGCDHVNVQPYSGSPANFEVYNAVLEFGDKVLAMDLSAGGHLTHGHKVNFSGKAYNFVSYTVDKETERIDYDKVAEIAHAEKPKMVISGASAYPREIDFKKFAKIAEEANAISFADISHVTGLILGEQHISPFPETDIAMTTTHKTLVGPRGAMIMCKEKYAKAIDKSVFPGMQGGPHNNVIAGKAVAFGEASQPEFKEYARNIVKNAQAMASALSDAGVRLVSGGTDNHLILADVTSFGIAGKEAETALDSCNITVNKNMVPFDARSPFDPSGIRFGTPTLTRRGFIADECSEIGSLIAEVIKDYANESVLQKVRERVKALTALHPMYE